MGACWSRGKESPREEGSVGSAGPQCTTFHNSCSHFHPFTDPQRTGTMADNGVSHFLENGSRICWKEQTIGLFPWPQPST